jgi:hypothetical protein
MEPARRMSKKRGPERVIQDNIIKMLKGYDWFVKETHGNMFQSGFPDLYAFHQSYGQRWIEVKNPENYKFTPAQLEWFPKFSAHQCGIWILVAATEEEYRKLFKPANWHVFLSIWRGAR